MISITLTRYAEPNWLVHETLASLSRQTDVDAEVLFVDQQDDDETRQFVAGLTTSNVRFLYETIPAKSLSYARNWAIRHSTNDILLYIDADAVAAPDWAAGLEKVLRKDGVGVGGGRIVPRWHRRPLWISRSRLVLEQYSMLDHGMGILEVPKMVGASFGIHKGRLGEAAYFDENLGRRDGILLGGEDTDLCIRAREMGLKVLYNGAAVIEHQVLPERINYRWIWRRFFFAGLGRAVRGGAPEPTHGMRFWDYVVLPIVLPAYGAGFMRSKISKPT